ncbi:MAG: YbhB/YbcL family Raf kinase inhibitor-like protein [bacterium]
MKISSPGFASEERIPTKHTCDNSDVNPTLNISGVPDNAKSLALVVDDPDAPMGTWTHWLLWNIDPEISSIDENTVPTDALQGKNDFGKLNWGGPCPADGEHHYSFKLFALDTKLDLHEGSTIKDLENAIMGHILEQAELVGIYSREDGRE